jgi:hypothetical protein
MKADHKFAPVQKLKVTQQPDLKYRQHSEHAQRKAIDSEQESEFGSNAKIRRRIP